MAALFGAPYLQTRTVHPDTCSCLPRHSSTAEWRPISRPTYCRLVGLGERNTAQSCVILMFGRRRWDVGPLVGVACLEPVGLGRRLHEEGNAMKRDSISVELVASGLEVTWENVAVSSERFCLTACILTLLEMMEQAATDPSRFRRAAGALVDVAIAGAAPSASWLPRRQGGDRAASRARPPRW